jgi:hypothetical protein
VPQQLSNFLPGGVAQLLFAIIAAIITSGCVTTGAGKEENEDPFAAYSVDEILEVGNGAFDSGEIERAVFIYMQALEIETANIMM